MKDTEVKKKYNAIFYIRKFFKFIGTNPNNFDLIKDTKTYIVFEEMGQSLENKSNFGDDLDEQVKKNETIRTYFGLILYEIKMGDTSGAIAHKLRPYKDKIVKSNENDEFNDYLGEEIDDIEDTLKENKINDLAQLSQAMNKVSEQFDEVGRKYELKIDESEIQKNVVTFIKRISKISDDLSTFNQNGGLIKNLHYSQFSKDQIQDLQIKMRDIIISSKKLFEKYGDELNES